MFYTIDRNVQCTFPEIQSALPFPVDKNASRLLNEAIIMDSNYVKKTWKALKNRSLPKQIKGRMVG
jgi:hypothetical protein